MNRLARIIENYPQLGTIPPDRLLTRHAGFSGAAVWKVATQAGPFAVRQWPAGWDRTRLMGLHRLLEFLRDSGLEFVAAPLRSLRGATLIESESVLLQIEPWLPGIADFRDRPSLARLTAAMTALARWHNHAARFAPAVEHRAWFRSEPSRPSPAVLERLERLRLLNSATIRKWEVSRHHEPATLAVSRSSKNAPLESVLLSRLTELILRHAPATLSLLDVAAAMHVPLQPVLRDVWHDHILFTGDAVTGVIDPAACRTESVAADLSRLLGSLCGDDAAAWEFALRAYQQQRPLSPAELGLIPVLDRSGVLLAGATWLEWLGPQQRFTTDDSRVAQRVFEIVKRLDALG